MDAAECILKTTSWDNGSLHAIASTSSEDEYGKIK